MDESKRLFLSQGSLDVVPDVRFIPVSSRQVSSTDAHNLHGALAILQCGRAWLADGTHRAAVCETGAGATCCLRLSKEFISGLSNFVCYS